MAINSSRKNEEAEPKWKQCPVVDGTGDKSKVQCFKNNIAQEPGMLGPWIKVQKLKNPLEEME